MESKTKRIFLGIPLSEEIKNKVEKIQAELAKIAGGFNLVKPENLHLTLKFIGEVKEEKISKIKEIVKTSDLGRKLKAKVRGIGAFPSENYVRVIWFGIENEERILDLQKKVDFSLSKMFPVEKEFLAHVTLSRVKFVKDKEKLKEFLAKFKDAELGEMEINKVILYESILKREGPEYITLEEFCLN